MVFNHTEVEKKWQEQWYNQQLASCDVNVTDVVFFAFPNAPNIGL